MVTGGRERGRFHYWSEVKPFAFSILQEHFRVTERKNGLVLEMNLDLKKKKKMLRSGVYNKHV